VFFHNIGMTGQVSGHFAEDMAKKGFETVSMDLRGHGLS
jgi:alpha-beta hydrolase superfamily lysophospholipase